MLRLANFEAPALPVSQAVLCVDLSTGLVAAPETATRPDDETLDCAGCIISPGFVDVQCNGAFGVDFSTESLTEAEVQIVLRGLLQYGVTAVCPTLVSSAKATYEHALSILLKSWQDRSDVEAYSGPPQCRNLGVHLEGPFLNPDRKGAHAMPHLRDCNHHAMEESCLEMSSVYGPMVGYLDSATRCGDAGSNGFIRIVTLAPELPGAMCLIRHLSTASAGIAKWPHPVVTALGHTTASYALCDAAVAAGARLVTHIFNAMPPLAHRDDPGPIALLGRPDAACCTGGSDDDEEEEEGEVGTAPESPLLPGPLQGPPYFSLIADGAHVHPAAVALAFRAAPHRCVLVTDSMQAMGGLLGPQRYGGLGVSVHAGAEAGDGHYPGPHAVLAGTRTLAGGVAPLDACLRGLARAVGLLPPPPTTTPLAGGGSIGAGTAHLRRRRALLRRVLRTVSANPAALLGLSGDLGSLAAGARGDLVLLHPTSLQVQRVLLGGRTAWVRAVE